MLDVILRNPMFIIIFSLSLTLTVIGWKQRKDIKAKTESSVAKKEKSAEKPLSIGIVKNKKYTTDTEAQTVEFSIGTVR